MVTNDDTLINGVSYKKVMYRGWDTVRSLTSFPPYIERIAKHPDNYWGALREDNKRVYFRFQVCGDTGERLIYDFNLNVGDTAPAYEWPCPIYSIEAGEIVTIDSVNIANVYHKRYVFASGGFVIEGVGSINGLVRFTPWLNFNCDFICYRNDQEALHASTTPCFNIWPHGHPTSVENVASEKQEIYPNPFHDKIIIESKAAEISVYNSMGEQVITEQVQGNKYLLKTEMLSSGVYSVVLRFADGKRRHYKTVKY
jgi:hypothetical protein